MKTNPIYERYFAKNIENEASKAENKTQPFFKNACKVTCVAVPIILAITGILSVTAAALITFTVVIIMYGKSCQTSTSKSLADSKIEIDLVQKNIKELQAKNNSTLRARLVQIEKELEELHAKNEKFKNDQFLRKLAMKKADANDQRDLDHLEQQLNQIKREREGLVNQLNQLFSSGSSSL